MAAFRMPGRARRQANQAGAKIERGPGVVPSRYSVRRNRCSGSTCSSGGAMPASPAVPPDARLPGSVDTRQVAGEFTRRNNFYSVGVEQVAAVI